SVAVATTGTVNKLTLTVDPGSGANTYAITDSGNLTFTATDAGNDLTLTNASVATGNLTFNLAATTGNISLVNGAVSTGNGNVTIQATTGSILDFTPATDTAEAAHITTTGIVTLKALGASGTIGASGAGDIDVSGTSKLTVLANNGTFVSNDTTL